MSFLRPGQEQEKHLALLCTKLFLTQISLCCDPSDPGDDANVDCGKSSNKDVVDKQHPCLQMS